MVLRNERKGPFKSPIDLIYETRENQHWRWFQNCFLQLFIIMSAERDSSASFIAKAEQMGKQITSTGNLSEGFIQAFIQWKRRADLIINGSTPRIIC